MSFRNLLQIKMTNQTSSNFSSVLIRTNLFDKLGGSVTNAYAMVLYVSPFRVLIIDMIVNQDWIIMRVANSDITRFIAKFSSVTIQSYLSKDSDHPHHLTLRVIYTKYHLVCEFNFFLFFTAYVAKFALNLLISRW